MIRDIKTVVLWICRSTLDTFVDTITLKLIDNIKADALGMSEYVKYYYDTEYQGDNNDILKHEINRQVNAYNTKAHEYNNKCMWYQDRLKPLSNWA